MFSTLGSYLYLLNFPCSLKAEIIITTILGKVLKTTQPVSGETFGARRSGFKALFLNPMLRCIEPRFRHLGTTDAWGRMTL